MSVKKYKKLSNCDIHNIQLVYSSDEYESWYECPECRKIDNDKFLDFLEDAGSKVPLWPVWKGGKGLGVGCPCCLGNEYVTKEFAEEVKGLLNQIISDRFLPKTKIKRNAAGQVKLK